MLCKNCAAALTAILFWWTATISVSADPGVKMPAPVVNIEGGQPPFSTAHSPLLVRLSNPIIGPNVSGAQVGAGPSLFAGRADGGLFAPMPEPAPEPEPEPVAPTKAHLVVPQPSDLLGIRDIIGHAESRHHGYDAVNYGAKIKPLRRPTDMTIGEIYVWIDATPGQPHAIGRYQFIPKTLKRLVTLLGVSEHERFSPAMQDRLSDQLLREAGLEKLRAGDLSRKAFMQNLAKIWAGLPMPTGKSYYHGYAGNKASMSWKEYDARMAQLFPAKGKG